MRRVNMLMLTQAIPDPIPFLKKTGATAGV